LPWLILGTLWEHWACVYNNKNMTLYKNGAQVATNTYTYSGAVTATMPFYIGTNLENNNSYFNGKIDDFGIWSRALSANEIVSLYNPCVPVMGDTMTLSHCGTYTSASGTTFTTTGIYTDTLLTTMGCDSIITLDLTITPNSYSSLNVSSCNTYLSPSGRFTWASTGFYNDTIPNAEGCDSIITINLTIKTVDKTLSMYGNTIMAALSDNYQWLNCDNNYSIIAGANSQSFSPTANGNYAVELTQNGCSDTSICISITTIGLSENPLFKDVAIYPNPSSGQVNIDLGELKNVNIRVVNSTGQLVFNQEKINTKAYQIELKEAPGIYYMELTAGDEIKQFKLLIL
jgi:hypothetical protein